MDEEEGARVAFAAVTQQQDGGVSLKRIGTLLAIVLGGFALLILVMTVIANVQRLSVSPEEIATKAVADDLAEQQSKARADAAFEAYLPNRLAKESTLLGAVTAAKPKFLDVVGLEPDPAAEAFTGWATQRLTWGEFGMLQPTTFALAQKDIEAARGQYIRTDRSKWGKAVDRGLLSLGIGATISFASVGSSGALVVTSHAGFCGVVTGTWDFPNVSGGVTQAVHLVGMFNLTENWGTLAKPADRP